jgi:hypothetical protein
MDIDEEIITLHRVDKDSIVQSNAFNDLIDDDMVVSGIENKKKMNNLCHKSESCCLDLDRSVNGTSQETISKDWYEIGADQSIQSCEDSCDGRTNKDKWARPAKNICRNHRCNRGHAKGYCGIQGRSKWKKHDLGTDQSMIGISTKEDDQKGGQVRFKF